MAEAEEEGAAAAAAAGAAAQRRDQVGSCDVGWPAAATAPTPCAGAAATSAAGSPRRAERGRHGPISTSTRSARRAAGGSAAARAAAAARLPSPPPRIRASREGPGASQLVRTASVASRRCRPSTTTATCSTEGSAWASFEFRDEDIFGNLLSKDVDDVPYAAHLPDAIWTCRVGEAASQARHYVEHEGAVALAPRHALVDLDAAPASRAVEHGLGVRRRRRDEAASPARRTRSSSRRRSTTSRRSRPSSCGGKQLAFFLDYDGTLTPIVDNPSDAILSEEARSVVRALAARYPTAIVSGRARATAQGLVQLDELYYAGSHGFDIQGPRKASGAPTISGRQETDEEDEERPVPSLSYQVADSFRPGAGAGQGAWWRRQVAGINGAMVEDNTFSVSVHYRMVAEGEDRERVEQVVDAVLEKMPMLKRTEGKMVYELRPSADWDKGKAVAWLLEQIRKEFAEDVELYPVYIGDDVTDEDAFRIMYELGGIGIKVSETAVEDGTAASWRLDRPSDVVQFLRHFAQRDAEGEIPPIPPRHPVGL